MTPNAPELTSVDLEEPQPQIRPAPVRYDSIDRILSALENGNIREAAMLCSSIMRDDRIKGVLGQRIGALLGRCLEFKPADTRAKSRKIAELLGGTDDEPGQWAHIFPAPMLEQIMQWGIMLNISVSEIVWYTDDTGQQLPRLKPWHPQHVTWDWNTRSFWIQTSTGRIELPQIDKVPHSDGRWFIHTPAGYQNAWLGGAILQLARLFLERGWSKRDWVKQSEKHGQPIDKVTVPSTASPEAKRTFFRKVVNRGSDTAVMVEQGAKDEPGYDFGLVEATARTWEVFQKLKETLDKDITVLINGQTMSTEGQGGLGSTEKPGEAVRLDVLRRDATLADGLYNQVVYWWALYNHGDGGLAPRPEFEIDPPEDGAARAKMHLDQANADNVYVQAGVLGKEEVAIARFGEGYSLDTDIDIEARKRALEMAHKKMEADAEAALEAAVSPPEQPVEAPTNEEPMNQ